MPQPSSILRKLGSNSSPLNIVGETSSALRVLLNRVKLVWSDAQGDRSVLSVDKVEPLLTKFCWLGLHQQLVYELMFVFYNTKYYCILIFEILHIPLRITQCYNWYIHAIWCICNFGMYSSMYLMYCNPMFILRYIYNIIESYCHSPMFRSRGSICKQVMSSHSE